MKSSSTLRGNPMTYPSKLKLFKAWSKAMEQGATVGKPDYGKSLKSFKKTRKRRRRRKKKHAD